MPKFRPLVSAAILAATIITGVPAMAADYSQETTNLIHFHLIDFVGWNNNDMSVMRQYHGGDVAVDMAGMHTDGIDPHVDAMTGMLTSGAEKIVQHSPSVAQGEWTAVVGITPSSKIATIGKWKDGVLSHEYLFLRQLTTEETNALDLSNPIATMATPDDQGLRSATGAEPGWSAVMADGFAVFTQTVDGKVAQTLGFATK